MDPASYATYPAHAGPSFRAPFNNGGSLPPPTRPPPPPGPSGAAGGRNMGMMNNGNLPQVGHPKKFYQSSNDLILIIPQGSKLATYMNRGGAPGGASNGSAAQMSQMVADLNNLGLDPNTLKKLSMSGIREFIPAVANNSTVPGNNSLRGGPSSASQNNSGSSSPFQGFQGPPPPSQQPQQQQQRLQPPSLNSFVGATSPRASPTPSTGSVNSMLPPQPPTSADQSQAQQQQDPSASIATYSDGGTTYFYSGEEMVSEIQNPF